jgi:hypothetical protein
MIEFILWVITVFCSLHVIPRPLRAVVPKKQRRLKVYGLENS